MSEVPRTIGEVQQNTSIVRTFRRLADIDMVVEYPLRLACKIFWDKNIRTIWSSANLAFYRHHPFSHPRTAFIDVDGPTLSETNQIIAGSLPNIHILNLGPWSVRMNYPIRPSTLVNEVEQYFANLAQCFQPQPLLYLDRIRFTSEQVKKMQINPPEYFAEDEGLWYLSYELYLKAHEFDQDKK